MANPPNRRVGFTLRQACWKNTTAQWHIRRQQRHRVIAAPTTTAAVAGASRRPSPSRMMTRPLPTVLSGAMREGGRLTAGSQDKSRQHNKDGTSPLLPSSLSPPCRPLPMRLHPRCSTRTMVTTTQLPLPPLLSSVSRPPHSPTYLPSGSMTMSTT